MKSNRIICLVTLATVAIISKADDVTLGGILYSVDKEAREASVVKGTDRDTLVIADSIEYEGVKYAVTCINSNAFTRVNVKRIVIGKEVKTIKANAFSKAAMLENIEIPDNVTSMGAYTFQNCTALKKAIIGRGIKVLDNYTFQGCSALETVTLNEGLVTIERYAFYKCSSLREIHIPASVAEIKQDVFNGCNKLETAVFGSLESLCKMKFYNELSNPLAYTGRLYVNDEEITDVNVPEGITSLNWTFMNCSGITSVTLPSSLREIGYAAFRRCSGLTSVIIPEGVTSIAEAAFDGCTSLKEISIPSSMKSIEKGCFWQHLSLYEQPEIERVVFASIESLCSIQFGDNYSNPIQFAQKLLINGEEIPDLVIPEGMTTIGDYAFYKCKGLKSIKFPDSIKEVGRSCFQNCSSLEKVEFASIESLCNTIFLDEWANPLQYGHNLYIQGKEITDLIIPDGIECVSSCTFQGSTITSVTMGDDVKSVGYHAFADCPNLKSAKFGKGIESIESCFGGCPQFDHVEFDDINCLLRMNFDDDFLIGNPLYFAHHLYSNGEEVKEITFPDGITRIGQNVLINCESVERIHVPEGVVAIWPKAFAYCKNLVSIDLPSTLQYCYSSVYGRGGSAFDFCESLEEIRINEDNPYYDSRDNCNAAIFTQENNLMIGCNSTIIPSSIEEINPLAFYGRTKLTSLYVPSSVVKIGGESFAECSSLTDFYYDARQLPKADNSVFFNTPIENATLHVPEDMIETFRMTAPWSGFGQIVALQPGDMPDGIETIQEPMSSSHIGNVLYDLQGRRLTKQPERGMYIENGRVRIR